MANRGNYNASGNLFPATGGSGSGGAILANDQWFVSVAGTLGGNYCPVGSSVRALSNAPGQTPGSWSISPPQKARVLFRADTPSNWASYDPILGRGEMAVTLGSNPPKIKIGDGAAVWSDLTYLFQPIPDTYTFNAYSTDHTLTVGDVCNAANGLPIVTMSKATANSVTVPNNSTAAIAVGSAVKIIQIGAGQTVLVADTGVTLNATPGLKCRDQYSFIELVKCATNAWYVKGDLSA